MAELNNGQPRRLEFKMNTLTFSGKGDFCEWKRKIELIYEAKGLTPEEKLTWTLPLLQDSAARLDTHTNPTTYRELMTALTTRFTDGNDEFHYRVALGENRQTGSIQDYVDRFLDLSSRLPNLADAEAKYALISGLKSEVQIHLLGQAHVTTLREALAELRVYAQARRGARPTTGSRADFGTAIGPTHMELDAHRSSRQRLTNTQSFRAPRPFSRGPPPRRNFNSNGPSRPSMQPHGLYQDRFRINSGN